MREHLTETQTFHRILCKLLDEIYPRQKVSMSTDEADPPRLQLGLPCFFAKKSFVNISRYFEKAKKKRIPTVKQSGVHGECHKGYEPC